jgi:hypothetical protein
MGAEVEVDTFFSDLYYPGSKRLRREAPETPVKMAERSWDSSPIKKMRPGGEVVEYFFPGSLAQALGKSAVTIRLWERRGYLPRTPYRLPGYTDARGKEHPGKRVYTRPMIEIAVEEFSSRGLLGNARIEWKKHVDLTIALVERWKNDKN